MSDTPAGRLTGAQVAALRFAAHRQLARLSKKPDLSDHQRAQRSELRRAVAILTNDAVIGGCELRAWTAERETTGGR